MVYTLYLFFPIHIIKIHFPPNPVTPVITAKKDNNYSELKVKVTCKVKRSNPRSYMGFYRSGSKGIYTL